MLELLPGVRTGHPSSSLGLDRNFWLCALELKSISMRRLRATSTRQTEIPSADSGLGVPFWYSRP